MICYICGQPSNKLHPLALLCNNSALICDDCARDIDNHMNAERMLRYNYDDEYL